MSLLSWVTVMIFAVPFAVLLFNVARDIVSWWRRITVENGSLRLQVRELAAAFCDQQDELSVVRTRLEAFAAQNASLQNRLQAADEDDALRVEEFRQLLAAKREVETEAERLRRELDRTRPLGHPDTDAVERRRDTDMPDEEDPRYAPGSPYWELAFDGESADDHP